MKAGDFRKTGIRLAAAAAALFAATAAGVGEEASRVPLPQVPEAAQGTQCVRDTEFMRGGYGDDTGVGDLLVDEVGNQRKAFLLGAFSGLLKLVLRDDTVLYQPSRQAGQIGL